MSVYLRTIRWITNEESQFSEHLLSLLDVRKVLRDQLCNLLELILRFLVLLLKYKLTIFHIIKFSTVLVLFCGFILARTSLLSNTHDFMRVPLVEVFERLLKLDIILLIFQ